MDEKDITTAAETVIEEVADTADAAEQAADDITEDETDAEDAREEYDDGFTDDVQGFDGDGEDGELLDADEGGEQEAEETEETEEAEEADEAQEQTADEKTEAGGDTETGKGAEDDATAGELAELRAQLAERERERERNAAALKKLGFDSMEAVRAYIEGVDVDEVIRRDAAEAEREAQENARDSAQKAAWAQDDIADIKRKYPDFSVSGITNLDKFVSMRENPVLREHMTAVEVYEYVERARLVEREAAAQAKRITSKEHLKAGKTKSVSPAATIPRDTLRMMKNVFPNKSEKELYNLYKSVT